jgi:hypothetical protein
MILTLLEKTSSEETLLINLNQNSSISYQLPSIIQGSTLDYSVKCSPPGENSATLSYKNAILTTKSLDLDSSLGEAITEAIQMSTRWFDGYGIGFYFTNTSVVCIKVDTDTLSMSVYWSYNFFLKESITNISGVQPFITSDNEFFVFIASKSYNENKFFIVDYENSENLDVCEVKLESLSQLESIQLYYNFRTNFVIISANDGYGNHLFIVNCTNTTMPTITQNISFIYSEANIKSLEINPISAFLVQYPVNITMVVLDKSKFIILYQLINDKFTEIFSLDIKEYIDPEYIYPYTYNGEYQDQLFIYTKKGILLVDLETMSEIMFINNSLSDVAGFFESNKFFYLLTDVDSAPSLAIAHLDYSQSILFNTPFNFNRITTKNTFWAIFQGNGQPLLLKINNGSATLTTIDAHIPVIEFHADASSNFNCTVTSTEAHSKDSSIYGIKNFSINILNDSFYNIQKVQEDKSFEIQKFYLNQYISNFSLPTYSVAGWNKTCIVGSKNLTFNNETLNITSTYKQSLDVFMNVKLGNDSIKAYLLDIFVINIKNLCVELTNIKDRSKIFLAVSNVTNVRVVSISSSQSALIFLYNQKSKILFYPYPTGKIKTLSLETCKNVKFFDAVSIYLILSNTTFIQLYVFNNITQEYEVSQYKTFINSEPVSNVKAVSRNTENLANLLYMQFSSLDNKTTIQVYNLETISIFSFPYCISQVTVSEFLSFNVTPSSCFFYHETETIVYDSLLNQQIFKFDIGLKNTWILNNSLLGIYNDEVIVLNSSEPLLNRAVFYSFRKPGSLIGFSYFDIPNKSGSLVAMSYENNAILYFLDCPNMNSECENSTPFSVDFKALTTSDNYNFTTNLEVNCSNYNSSVNISFNVVFFTYGMKIFMSESQYIVDSIAYSTEDTFPLREYAQGSDLQLTLSINNRLYNRSSKLAPVKLEDSIILSYEFSTKNKIYSMSMIKNSTYVIISAQSGIIFLYDYTTGNRTSNFSAIDNFNSTCPIIETVARTEEQVLFALSCITYITEDDHQIRKPSVGIISFSSTPPHRYIYKDARNPEFIVGSIRAVTSDNQNFVLILVEETNRTNNHVQVVFGHWNNTSVELIKNYTINFYTMNLSKFLCEGADGYYNYLGYLELYLVDSYFGLRVLNYSNDVFNKVYNHKISQPVKSIGVCGKVLFVGCLDTSVMTFGKYNKNFEYLAMFNPYNNASKNYKARSGYINCDNYYNPIFFALPIESSSTYVMRIINTKIDPASSVLRDILISNYTQTGNYYSNAYFINSSMFFVADTTLGVILGYTIKIPSLIFPKYSASEYEKVQKIWGGSPFKYFLNITSGDIQYKITKYHVDRGALKVSSSSVSTKIATWKIALIIIGVSLALIVIGFVSYKYFWKRKKLLKDLNLDETQSQSSVIYRNTMQFFAINHFTS